MKGFHGNIEQIATAGEEFRRVLYTARHMQLVVMCVPAGGEIGEEVHEGDQFLRFESGQGKVIIDGNVYAVRDGDAVIVPAGATHNVVNGSMSEALKLYTVYAPPHHKDGTVHATKEAAMKDEEEFDGTTTESVAK